MSLNGQSAQLYILSGGVFSFCLHANLSLLGVGQSSAGRRHTDGLVASPSLLLAVNEQPRRQLFLLNKRNLLICCEQIQAGPHCFRHVGCSFRGR